MTVKIKQEEIQFFDKPLATGYRFVLAHNIDFKNGSRYTTSLELQGILTAPLIAEAKGPISTDWIDPTNEFLHNPYNLEKYPESIGTSHPKSNMDRSCDNLTLGTEYLSVNFSYRFGKLGIGPTLSIYLQEDWKLMVANGDGIKLLYGGTNAQDLGTGIKIVLPFKLISEPSLLKIKK
jgi:hypothetical protein